jgi:hypothetical protein
VLFPSLWRAVLAGAATCAALAALTIPARAAVVPASAASGGPAPSGSSYGFNVSPPPGVAAASTSVPSSLKAPGSAGALPRQLFVPDLIAAAPAGISPAQLARISKLTGVRSVLPVDGGKVSVNGHSANVLGVPAGFRSWTPPETAAANAVWTDLSQGKLVSTPKAAGQLRLSAGNSYPVAAAVQERLPFGARTALSVPGADVIVNQARSAQLGLA